MTRKKEPNADDESTTEDDIYELEPDRFYIAGTHIPTDDLDDA